MEQIQMQSFKIFCANVHLFRGTFIASIYTKLQYEDDRRCDELCRYFRESKPDVICLVEIWGASMRQKIIKELIDIYPYSWIPPHDATCFKVGPEHLFLSKYPMSQFCHENYKDLGGWDKWAAKKICGCVIRNTFVCCTHLDSNLGVNIIL